MVHGHHGGLPYSGHFIVRRGLLVVGHGSGGLCDACASICLSYQSDKERIRMVQQYKGLKANSVVAKALIESSTYYKVSEEDSSVFSEIKRLTCISRFSAIHIAIRVQGYIKG